MKLCNVGDFGMFVDDPLYEIPLLYFDTSQFDFTLESWSPIVQTEQIRGSDSFTF